MINKITWAWICLVSSALISCTNSGSKKAEGKIDSLVTRTKGEVWGFMKADSSSAPAKMKILTKQIYPLETSIQQWPAIVNDAKANGQQIYLSKIFSAEALKQLLNKESQQTEMINNLLVNLKERSASGIVLEFGYVGKENVPRYLKLIKKLADTLHNEKLSVAVITLPHNSFTEKDITILTEAIDYTIFDFTANYSIEGKDVNPYVTGEMSVAATMKETLMAPINLHKVLLLIPAKDKSFNNNSDFILHVGLAGVAIKYTGTGNDIQLTDSLAAKFQYVDTIKVRQ